MPEGEFVLDLDSNPHPDLLELALTARRRARQSDTNHAASAYYLGVLHACCKATGCDESEMVRWLEHHDHEPTAPKLDPLMIPMPAIDLAVRARRLARMSREPVVFRYWQGMLDLLAALLGDDSPDLADAFVGECDPDPFIAIAAREVPVALSRDRVDRTSP